ncbi:MAG TPA: hypothetical protein PKD12_02835 [Nitrospira sp.]|nr:hypothetical protein [Nitrospira sp.]
MSHAYWIQITKIQDKDQSGNGGGLHYEVTLFADTPNRRVPPLAKTLCMDLRGMNIKAHDEARVSQDPYVAYGNRMAEWLFCEQGDRERLNSIGRYLKQAENLLAVNERLRLLVSIEHTLLRTDLTLQVATFFQSLSGAEHFRVEAVRTVWDESNDTQVVNKAQKRPVAEKLQVLAVLANPDPTEKNKLDGFPNILGLENEFDALMDVLLPLQHYQDAPIVVEPVRQASLKDLREAIHDRNPHVIVFLGHGYGLAKGGDGGLVCVEQGEAKQLGYEQLKAVLNSIPGGANLRVVVLLACQSFVAAPVLLGHGVSAVVGMQPYGSENFPWKGAKPFAEPFFRFLAEFRPVGQALQQGIAGLRDHTWQEQDIQQLRKNGQVNEDWLKEARHLRRAASVMPTLWLAGADDRLFAETEARQRAAYRKKLSEQLTVEWSGLQRRVALDAVFVAPPCQDQISNQPIVITDEIVRTQAVVIQGDEWSGKSTLAHWAVLNAFATGDRTPILVSLRELKANEHLEQWLAKTGLRGLGLNAPEEMVKLIMGDCQNGTAILIIDDVDRAWLAQPPNMLRQRLFGHDHFTSLPLVVTASIDEQACHPAWKCLVIQRLTVEQQVKVAEAYGRAIGAEQATQEFVEWLAKSDKHITGIPALAERSGFLVLLLGLYLQRKVLLKDETDLLETVQYHRWRKKVSEQIALTQPDEPVYKQQILEALGFHLYFCRGGQASGAEVEQVLRQVLEQQDEGDGPIYRPTEAPTMLQEYTDVRHFLRGNRQDGWVFRSPEWLRFYAASQMAALVNGQDKAIVGWIEGTTSLHCQSCGISLGRWDEHVAKGQGDQVRAAVRAALEEVLPAWKRTDPWDCTAIRQLRRVLVQTLPLR